MFREFSVGLEILREIIKNPNWRHDYAKPVSGFLIDIDNIVCLSVELSARVYPGFR
jgi:hypothetical protein